MVPLSQLNYHHLRYFWSVAREGNLTRTARRLRVSQSALSVQIRLLEDELGRPLFVREGRALVVTEAGQIVLAYADRIFGAGEQLLSTLRDGRGRQDTLRIGAVATLSRNFQLELLRPLLQRGDVRLKLQSGTLRELLPQLGSHGLDLVLSNDAVPRDAAAGWHSALIAEQPLSLVSRKPRGRGPVALDFPQGLDGQPLLLPGEHSAARLAFDTLLQQAGVYPQVLAEVDDMAMLRVLARDTGALALVPPVVVQDELRSGALVERCQVPQIRERFYAVTGQRRFAHPLVRELLQALRAAG